MEKKDNNKNGHNLLMTHKIHRNTLCHCDIPKCNRLFKNAPSRNVAEGREIMENAQTEAKKREGTSVKPGERLTTASESCCNTFQSIYSDASWNDPTPDEKNGFLLSLCRKSLHNCVPINIVTTLLKFLTQPQWKCQKKPTQFSFPTAVQSIEKGWFYCWHTARLGAAWSESGATRCQLHLPLGCLKSCSLACVPLLNINPLHPQALSPTPAGFLQLPDECGTQ